MHLRQTRKRQGKVRWDGPREEWRRKKWEKEMDGGGEEEGVGELGGELAAVEVAEEMRAVEGREAEEV